MFILLEFWWSFWICWKFLPNLEKLWPLFLQMIFLLFAAILLFDIFLQFTMVLIFLFCFCSFISVLYFDISYCSLQVPWFFFYLQNAICYWEFPVNFSFQILHFSCLEVPFGSYIICFSPDYVVVFSKYLNTVILADLMYVN